MLRRLAATAVVALSLSLPAAAQDLRALAQSYVALPANQQMMRDMFSPESLGAQFASGLPAGMTISDAQRDAVGALMSGAMIDLIPLFEETMVDAAASTFDEAELTALIDFYSSEVGASILLKMQPFFQTTMARIQPRVMETTQALLPQLVAIVQGN